jgi:hypothetical protein
MTETTKLKEAIEYIRFRSFHGSELAGKATAELSALEADNAKLREERDAAISAHETVTTNGLKLMDSNDKLREELAEAIRVIELADSDNPYKVIEAASAFLEQVKKGA